MRDDVTIVLNEREPFKAKLARTLVHHFTERGVTVSTVPVTSTVGDVVKRKRPRVCILDYLLGDYTTGLDILEALSELEPEERPIAIFFTDEPSLSVAVDALRLGARDYVSTQSSQGVERVVSATLSELRRFAPAPSIRVVTHPTIGDLVFEAPPSRALRDEILAAASLTAGVTVLCGPSGSGRTILAHALAAEHPSSESIPHRRIDGREHRLRRLGARASFAEARGGVIIDEVEFLNIESTLDEALRFRTRHAAPLIITTEDLLSAQHVARRLKECRIIEIPPLSDRAGDLTSLVLHFTREAQSLTRGKVPMLDGSCIEAIRTTPWPGDLRELRAVVIETLLDEAYRGNRRRRSVSREGDSRDGEDDASPSDATPLITQLLTTKEAWERHSLASDRELMESVTRAVTEWNGDIIAAAAHLGILPKVANRILDSTMNERSLA